MDLIDDSPAAEIPDKFLGVFFLPSQGDPCLSGSRGARPRGAV